MTIDQVAVHESTTTPTNGHHVAAAEPASAPAPAPAPAGAPAASTELAVPAETGYETQVYASAGEAVMAQYHEVMQRFLLTEQAVMLTYLGNADAAPAQPVVTSRPRIAPLAMPAVAAAPAPAPAPVAAPAPAAPATNGSNGNGTNGAAAPAPTPAPAPVAEAPAPAPAPAAAAPAPAAAPAIDVSATLLEIVQDRTGYPLEMLDLDADLEADLGIDSIKRVEIIGTMIQQLELPESVEIDRDSLAGARSLREVIGMLEKLVPSDAEVVDLRVPF